MRRDGVRILSLSESIRVLEWAGLAAADELEECTLRPSEFNAEEHRRMFEAPAPCAQCQQRDTVSFPLLLDTGPELRWLPLCGACTDAHLAHLSAIVDRMYGPVR